MNNQNDMNTKYKEELIHKPNTNTDPKQAKTSHYNKEYFVFALLIPIVLLISSYLFFTHRNLMVPFLYLVFLYVSNTYKKYCIEVFPIIFFTRHLNEKVTDLLSYIPRDVSTSWDVSQLYVRYLQIKTNQNLQTENSNFENNKKELDDILITVSNLIKKDSLTESQFLKMRVAITESEKQVSRSTKITDFFTIVNFIWLVAVIGSIISFGPFVYQILLPLRTHLYHIGRWIWENIIVPCHDWGVYEVMCYMLSGLIVVEGYRYNNECDGKIGTGFGISFSAQIIFYFSLFYSMLIHKNSYNNDKIWVDLFICLSNIPISVRYNSQLIAYSTTVLFYVEITDYKVIMWIPYLYKFIMPDDRI